MVHKHIERKIGQINSFIDEDPPNREAPPKINRYTRK